MQTIVFGIRESLLARRQLEELIAFLRAHEFAFDGHVKTMTTSGDEDRTRPIDQMGEGIFTKEIASALLRGEIDCAVHSLKDVPVQSDKGAVLSCYLPRHDARDCLVVRPGVSGLKKIRVGTDSPRRAAFLK
jgi:porphobilinogen deaminase